MKKNLSISSAFCGDLTVAGKILQDLKTKKTDSPRIRLAEGVFLLRNRKINEAEAVFKNYATQNHPADQRWCANFGLGRIALLKGQHQAAEKFFLAAHAAVPERTAWQLATFYQNSGQLKTAAGYLEEEIKYSPYKHGAFANLGEIYAALEDKAKLGKLRKTLRPKGKNDLETAYYLDALIEFLNHNFAPMLNKLGLCKSYQPRPLYRLMKLTGDAATGKITELPEDVRLLLGTGPTAEQKKRITDLLLPMLAEAAKNNNRDNAEILAKTLIPLLPEKSPDALLVHETLMRTAFLKQDFYQARREAAIVLRMDPNSAAGNTIMAETLLAAKQPEESLNYFRKLPQTKNNVINYAAALSAAKKYGETEKLLEDFRKKHPGDPAIFDLYAGSLMLQKKYAKAAALAKSLPATPVGEYTANFLLAQIAEAEKKTAESRTYYQKAIAALEKMKPTPQITYQTAYLYALTDQNKKAEELYEQLLKQNPQWALILVNLSEVKAALGDEKGAMQLAEQAMRLYPNWNAAQMCLQRRKAEYAKAHPPAVRKKAVPAQPKSKDTPK